MKKLAAAGLVIAVIAAQFSWYSRSRNAWDNETQASTHLIRIATTGTNPPFNFVDANGELQGFDIDIANALCVQMRARCKIVQEGWHTLLLNLINGKYDAVVSSVPITPQFRQAVSFSDGYYRIPSQIRCCGLGAKFEKLPVQTDTIEVRFVDRKDASITISEPGLSGKRIGILEGSVYENILHDRFPTAVAVTYSNQSEAVNDMVARHLDLLFANPTELSATFLNTDRGKNFEFVGPSVTYPEALGIQAGIAVRKEDTHMLNAFNKALGAIREDGTYKQVNDKYFDFDIDGG